MKKGYKMSKKSSKNLFKRTASRTHKFNKQQRHSSALFMRGGIRL